MIGAEIAQEVADRAAVMTSRVGAEGNTEGIDRAVEEGSQRMLPYEFRRGHEGAGIPSLLLSMNRANQLSTTVPMELATNRECRFGVNDGSGNVPCPPTFRRLFMSTR